MLSENLKRLREEKGYSKKRLERETQVSARCIEFIEHGKIKNPRLDTLQRLASALGATVEELIQ